MEFRCESCKKNFQSEESLKQHNTMKHFSSGKKGKINMKKYVIISLILLIILFSFFTINSFTKKPGEYDEFASCLTENGVKVYGNDHCSYTVQQLNYFGKSKKLLNYIQCIDNENICDEKEITVTPTWEINGEMYEQVQGFEKLAAVSGCEI